MTDNTFKQSVDAFMQHCTDILETFDSVSPQDELRAIRRLFDRYDDDQLIKLFGRFFQESPELGRSLTSFNYTSITSQVVEIPVKTGKKPKLRIGYLYRKSEESSHRGHIENAHMNFMYLLLDIAELADDQFAEEYGRARSIYNSMMGQLPQSNNLMGILDSIPGVNGIINGFLTPDLIGELKNAIEESRGQDLKPEMVKDIVDRMLDKLPQFESHRTMISGILSNVMNNPTLLSQLSSDPSSLMNAEGLSTLLPSLIGGVGGGSQPVITDEAMKEAMEFNPYA